MISTTFRFPSVISLWVVVLPLLAFQGCQTATDLPIPAPDNSKDYGRYEEALGQHMEIVFGELYRYDDDPELINRLRRIGRKLAPHTERMKITYSFRILDTNQRNAVSLTNGRILFTRGLFVIADDDDLLAAVIGHEMAHINLRHGLQQLEREEKTLWQRIFLMGTIGLIPVAGSKLSYLILDHGYDHFQEYEADIKGIEYMTKAGYDPRAAIRLFERVEKDPECRKQRSLLSTHPRDRDRIQTIENYLNERASNTNNTKPEVNTP